MAINVFITDDHYMVVEGIRVIVESAPGMTLIGHASNSDSCLAFLQQQQPEVILMDINMPGKSGIDLCKEVKARYPTIYILGLSTFNQQSFIQKMMENGASGYILKNASREEVIEAIETVVRGEIFLSTEAAATLEDNKDALLPVITQRERQVLQLIAQGLTNNEIAEKLFISSTTVDTHRKNLLTKFKAPNAASLIRMAVQMQFI